MLFSYLAVLVSFTSRSVLTVKHGDDVDMLPAVSEPTITRLHRDQCGHHYTQTSLKLFILIYILELNNIIKVEDLFYIINVSIFIDLSFLKNKQN